MNVTSPILAGAGGAAFALALLASPLVSRADTPQSWPLSGGDIHNSRAVLTPVGPHQLRPLTAPNLHEKWEFTTAGDVSATPTVEQGGLYFPDWAGKLYKLDPKTGSVIWQRSISDMTGDPNSKTRSSPAIAGNALYIGDLSIARVIAVDKNTGSLLWRTSVDSNSNSMLTSSPTVYNGVVLVGTASREESGTVTPSFRGKVVALNAQTGAILWQFTTVPPGYTGGAVVPSPVVDERTRSVYVVTDNNYTIPDDVERCVGGAGSDMTGQLACLDPADYVDAALAFDLDTGQLKWSRRFQGADTWTQKCNTAAGCDQPPGLDFDFAGSPNLFKVRDFVGYPDDRGGTSNSWLLGIGQKSGMYRAINPVNGGVFWSTLVGRGGIQWGSAVDLDDQTKIYVAVKNDSHRFNTLTSYKGSQTAWNAGSWNALDARTGAFVWQVPAYGRDLTNPQAGSAAWAPLSFSNYVVFGGTTSGHFAAMSATNGSLLWTFQSGGTVMSGPAFFDDWVYWGTGYARLGGVGYHKFYAFAIDD